MKRTTPIVCAKAPRYIAYVPAIRGLSEPESQSAGIRLEDAPVEAVLQVSGSLSPWSCSYCGQRVKVVA